MPATQPSSQRRDREQVSPTRRLGEAQPTPQIHHDAPLDARYRLVRELGRGGTARVHLAFDLKLRRCVALKQHRGHPDGEDRDALRREALALACICDMRVVAIYDYGVQNDTYFLALEYVPGVTLGEWQAHSRRSRRDLMRVYLAAGHGLAAVHRAGLVHRDFKPENVMVGQGDAIKLVDLGLAVPRSETRGERAGAGITSGPGTPLYIAPEQLLGRPVDERADQFSFCVALYRALYGPHPFAPHPTWPDPSSGTELNALFGRLTAASGGARIPAGRANDPAWHVLRRGLARAPEARYRSMPELLGDLTARVDVRATTPPATGISPELAWAIGQPNGLRPSATVQRPARGYHDRRGAESCGSGGPARAPQG